ncbi:Nif3-like dinuclear metal center hexameric protein [Mangrovibacterium diazotrophicum]|uniref:GTP cyclohydrolase 1 type 2 homolog n=1 Tax=Mangrovibacterium diazotrophicum TaxID=1261403 RepID=A0A419VX10_9BACT|nr:Nif3-like dinuclear metal center hexameric protein [Mangrovibacterium diazotrophicum]RKD87772.1 dinuclear metal center YbgI/SA1388 family protein [Mangrovibacterium diazotrophicum]
MKISEITKYIESIAPLAYQESYDNAGLLVGHPSDEVSNALICLDVTEAVVDEAIREGFQLILAHHPIIFGGLKKLNGKNEVERCVIKAIKNDIAIYAAHTNLDSVHGGVNSKICEKLKLMNCKVLAPAKNQLKKLVTFIPEEQAAQVQQAVFEAGAGHIGNYDSCGYSTKGEGSFRAGESANPFVGEKGQLHVEKEIRFETIFPAQLQGKVLAALLSAHPYEEVAYDIYPLDNTFDTVGAGMVGELDEEISETDFLKFVKEQFQCKVVRHSQLLGRKVKKVAVCGGAGSFLIRQAIGSQADLFITGDMKYHQFFEAEGKIVIADIGHFESEQYTKEVFYELLTKKFPKFAVRLSAINTNPINYLI